MKKRLLSLTLASIMLVGSLAGCGGGTAPAASDGNTAGGANTPAAKLPPGPSPVHGRPPEWPPW